MPTEISQLKGIQGTAAPDRERVSHRPGDAGALRGAATAQGGSDEVRLSNSALRLQEAERRLASHPDIDEARIATIREALNNGTYQVNAANVADRILEHERQFLAGGGP